MEVEGCNLAEVTTEELESEAILILLVPLYQVYWGRAHLACRMGSVWQLELCFAFYVLKILLTGGDLNLKANINS